MKKLINDPKDYVDEALEGLCGAFAGYRRAGSTGRVIVRADGPVPGKVAVVAGGSRSAARQSASRTAAPVWCACSATTAVIG